MTRPASNRTPLRVVLRFAAAVLIGGAAAAAIGCASSEPWPPSPAAEAVAETRAAAGLPPPQSSATQPVPPQPSPVEPVLAEGEEAPASTGGVGSEPADGEVAAADAARSSGSAPSDPAAVPAPSEESAAEGRRKVPKVVTIGPKGGIGAEPRTLAEAAAEARAERRSSPERALLVITNDNLAAFAAPGQVTVMTSEPAGAGEAVEGPEAAATAGSAPSSADGASESDEQYWRERARDTRRRWAAAAEEVERLQKEADELRWAFYAEDDGYYRDERIKPEWDRVLDDLRRARQDVRAYRREVEELLEEGRRAGALPGWLREGVELEPEEPESRDRQPRTSEPVEPPVMGKGDRP